MTPSNDGVFVSPKGNAMPPQEFSSRFPISPITNEVQAVNVKIVADESRGGAVAIADGADIVQGSLSDDTYDGENTPTLVSLLKGIYQRLSNVVLSAGDSRIGKVTVRNSADTKDIDPLSEKAFTDRIGEAQDVPGAHTLLDRLKQITAILSGPLLIREPIFEFNNYSVVGNHTARFGSGHLEFLIINTPSPNGVIKVYDNTQATGILIGTISFPENFISHGPISIPYRLTLNTGLSVSITGADMDITLIHL